MPSQKNNHVMHGTQGMFGSQVVFKIRGGKMFVAAPPQFKEGRVATTKELAVRDKFKLAVAYAKAAIQVLLTKEAYLAVAQEGQTAFNVAFQDAYNPPVVKSINKDGYQGQIGNTIQIQASDDFKVEGVKVVITNADGSLLEQGAAVLDAEGVNWVYTATQANATVTGSKITATATDLPGNSSSLEVTL